MAYIPTVWQNNAVTPVNAENLNHQEAGIVLADTNATNAINRVTVVEASQADAIARLAIINEAEGIRVSNEIAREKKLISIGNRFVKALGTRLSACVESACILVQGDSTGVSNARWFYLIVQWLASKFPKYTVSYRTWNDANQSYDAPTVIQYGTLGDAYISLPSGTGNYISTPDNASLQITGDMDIQAKINGGYYGANIAIVSQFGSLGQRGYDFGLDGAGHLFLWWSSDGTANTYVTSSAIVPVTNGQDLWVMVRFDVDNGSGGSTVAFNTSFDGLTWNQLGTLIVTAGVTTIFNSTVPLEIGSRSGGTTENFLGKIYEVTVKNGMNGKVVASFNADRAFPVGTTLLKDAEGNVYTVNGACIIGNGSPGLLCLNGSKSGANLAYSSDVTRFALQTPIEPQLSFINYSHNEGTNIFYQTQYEAFCAQLLAKYPNIGIICTSQNPQTSPNVYTSQQAIRCGQIATLSAKNDYGLIDIFRAFTETGNVAGLLIDGTHPTDAVGSPLWASKVIEFLSPVVT